MINGMKHSQHNDQERGFVSIFSVLIIMSILTLVAIGFSNITRTAQKRTLDSQLNTQAFYAAESGVNEAKKALLVNPLVSKTGCEGHTTPSVPGTFDSYTLDPTLVTGFTCVLINPATDLQFDSVTTEGSSSPKTGTIESSSGNFAQFTVSWTGPDKTSVAIPSPAVGSFPRVLETAATWGNKLGMLRIDLVPIDGSLSRDTLALNTISFYLYPTTTSTAPVLGAFSGTRNQAGLLFVRCAAATSPCSATVNLNPISSKFYVRVQSLYNPVSSVGITDFKSNSGTALNTKSSQVVIDSTGKANDVLRRIQVRIPQNGNNGFSTGFAIQSGDSICKRLQVGPPDNVTATITDIPGDPTCQTN